MYKRISVFRGPACACRSGGGGSGSDAVNDDECWRGALLARLAHGALLGELGKDARRAQVVDASMDEAGCQAQLADLLGPQRQLVLGLPQPREGAMDLQSLWAAWGGETAWARAGGRKFGTEQDGAVRFGLTGLISCFWDHTNTCSPKTTHLPVLSSPLEGTV